MGGAARTAGWLLKVPARQRLGMCTVCCPGGVLAVLLCGLVCWGSVACEFASEVGLRAGLMCQCRQAAMGRES